ncbi:DinB family protein [Rhodopirellula sp. JC740]|uniref:DinB family protein n=1 Tax=Rhodopirellula halodulae TaxID=2894198 RepID=A0ABS8NP07_9BACT|nr:DinB family protein [Rhodopirellula sp. JC740]MCC9645287.1 DinB family protein [Rhodopirellula sp. JC740]
MPSSLASNRSRSRRPSETDLSLEYHRDLAGRLSGDCVFQVMEDQLHWMCELASSLSVDQTDKVHPPYGWTIRQVIGHCADAERIWGDRMLRLAAGDPNDQLAWDENAYADARFGLGNMRDLISELGYCRQANITFLRRINPTAWNNVGSVDGNRISVRGIAWVAAGHLQHHFEIIEKRCDIQVSRKPAMT